VELYARVRRAVLVEGKSQRAVAREFGLARMTVRKMLEYSLPPGYQRQQSVRRPKLGPWLGVIDAILKEDKTRPAKQRHTAKRIFERLRNLCIGHHFCSPRSMTSILVDTAEQNGQK
jgi:transposase